MDSFGYVYKIYENKAVILTPQKGFITIKVLEGMKLGQRVYYNKNDTLKPKRLIYYYSSIASVLVIAFICFKIFTGVSNIYGYVDIDINPSIEFAINKDYVVLDAKPMNDDASKVLSGSKLKGKSLNYAITDIINKSEYYKYINIADSNTVLVSIALNDKSKYKNEAKDENELNEYIDSVDKLNNKNIDKYTIKVELEEREEALNYDISMGKYSAYLKVKENDSSFTIDDAKKISTSELLKRAGYKGDVVYQDDLKSDPLITDAPKDDLNANKVIEATKVPENTQKEKIPEPRYSPTKVTEPINTQMSEPTLPRSVQPTVEQKLIIEQKRSGSSEVTPTQNVIEKPLNLYDFEDGIGGFYISEGGSIYSETKKKYDGSKSMKVSLNSDKDIYVETNSKLLDLIHGKIISFRVWVPDNSNIKGVIPFIKDSNWSWYQNWQYNKDLKKNEWNTITLEVPKEAKLPIRSLGVKIATNGKLNGDLFIDSISWP